MKKLFLLGLIIANCQLLSVNCFAQAPKLMNYQGVVRDANGQTLVNKTVNLRLSILSAADITDAIYKEEQSVTTTEFGLFAIKIGEGSPIKGSMADIDWSSADHFVAVELDAENNGHFQFMGTSQLLSVPYAFYAEKAGKAMDLENMDNLRTIDFDGTFGQTIRHNGTDWVATSNLHTTASRVGIGTTSPVSKLDVNGNINISSGSIITVGEVKALEMDEARNFMMGRQSGDGITTGENNNFIGDKVASGNTTGSNNNMIGYRAGFSNTTGDANIFYGYKSGYSNTTGSNNSFIGLHAGYNSVGSQNNIAIGTKAGENIADGKDNTFVGRQAGQNTTADKNTFIGKDAGLSNTTGIGNTYIGFSANGNVDINNATAIGAHANVTQSNSLVLGNDANVGIGTSAPAYKLHLKDGNMMVEEGRIEFSNSKFNTYIGDEAGGPSDGVLALRNVAVGHQALNANTNGFANIAIGSQTLFKTTTGGYNVAVGSDALWKNTTGRSNVTAGHGTMYNNTTGDFNVALGESSSFNNITGDFNVAIGNASMLTNKYGSSNTTIGYYSDVLSDDLINATAIGANSKVGCDSCLVLGNASKVGIGTTTPADKLHIEGSIRMVDGNQAAGYVMTSDANGTATWQPLQSLDATNGIYTPCELALHLDIEFNSNNSPAAVLDTYLWQEVIPTSNVDLAAVGILFQSTAFSGGTLNIYDGSDTSGTLLYTGAAGALGTGWQIIELTSPIPVTTGSPFTFELTAPTNFSFKLAGFDEYPGACFSGSGTDVVFRTYKLDCDTGYIISPVSVNGTVNLSNVDTIYFSDGSYQVSADTADVDWTVNGNNQYSALSGNVGIGTTSPADKLHLVGDMRLDAGRIDVKNTGGSVLIGENAGAAEDFTDRFNVFIGTEAGLFTDTGSFNSGVGNHAMTANTTGTYNAAFGSGALGSNETGSYNAAFGAGTLDAGGAADEKNTAIGFEAGAIAAGSSNVFIGYRAGKSRSGSNQLFIENTGADKNSALIYGEFDNNILAFNANVGVGTTTPADKLHVIGDIRLDAGRVDVKNTGGSVIIGENAGAADDFSNNDNTFIGTQAGQVTTGQFNAGIGSYSLLNNSTGGYNVGVGTSAISNVTTGSYNSALGVNTLGLGGPTDEKNTAIGFEAGNNITGSSNVFIGFRAGRQRSGSNQLFIENSGADKNNALIYGEFDNNVLAFNANVGINTSSPSAELHVVGDVRIQDGTQGDGKVLTSDANGTASWQALSTLSDNQTIDQFTISNDTLQLSLESDGQAPQVVSLVGYKVPVGTITMYIGESDNIPDGWLFCGGQSFSGATYPELQSLLGGTNTPNLKGRFPFGAKPIVNVGETPYPLKGTGGEEEVTLTIDEMPSHTHDVTVTFREAEEQGSGNNYSDLNGGSSDSRTYTSAATGNGQAHNNMPPFYSVNFIIKAN